MNDRKSRTGWIVFGVGAAVWVLALMLEIVVTAADPEKAALAAFLVLVLIVFGVLAYLFSASAALEGPAESVYSDERSAPRGSKALVPVLATAALLLCFPVIAMTAAPCANRQVVVPLAVAPGYWFGDADGGFPVYKIGDYTGGCPT